MVIDDSRFSSRIWRLRLKTPQILCICFWFAYFSMIEYVIAELLIYKLWKCYRFGGWKTTKQTFLKKTGFRIFTIGSLYWTYLCIKFGKYWQLTLTKTSLLSCSSIKGQKIKFDASSDNILTEFHVLGAYFSRSKIVRFQIFTIGCHYWLYLWMKSWLPILFEYRSSSLNEFDRVIFLIIFVPSHMRL